MTLPQLRSAQLGEARLVLRFAAGKLNRTERAAIHAFLCGVTDDRAGVELGITGGGVFMARKAALRKLRKRLELLGVRSAADLVSEEGPVAE